MEMVYRLQNSIFLDRILSRNVCVVCADRGSELSKRSLTSDCFSRKFSRTVKMKESFRRIGISVLNSIPHSVTLLIKSKFRNNK